MRDAMLFSIDLYILTGTVGCTRTNSDTSTPF